MSNEKGGKRIKIDFGTNENKELKFRILELEYPHSDRAKRFLGGGVWILWEQKCFHRPAQAFDELFFALRDLNLIGNDAGLFAALSYFKNDMDITRSERLKNLSKIPFLLD